MSNIFVYWLGALPLIIWNGGYERPKVMWFLVGSFFLVIYWLKNRASFSKLLTRADLFFLLWLLVLLISGLAGPGFSTSIIGGSYRYQGVVFFFALWILGKTINALSKRHKELLAKFLSRVVIFEAILVIVQKFLAPATLIFGRPLGTFGEPNAVAGFLAGGAVFIGSFPVLLVIFFAIVLTSSRAGLVAFVFVGAGILLRKLKLPLRRWLMLGAVTALAGIFFFAKAQASRPESVFENRSLFWEMAVGFIKEKPILGYGPEAQELLYDAEYAKREMPLSGLIIDRSHNLFLDVAIWSGILGLLLFVGWIFVEMLNLFRKRKYMNLFGVIALLTFSMFQPLGVTHWALLIVLPNMVSFKHG